MTEPRLQANSSQHSLGLEYFSTPSRLGLIQQIAYILQFGEGLPVVQGGSGSGKTFIATELGSNLSVDAMVGRINLHQQNSDLEGVLRDIAQSLSLSTAGMKTCGELLVSLRHYSRELVELHQLAVVIVDNAHLLNESSLGALLSLLQGDFEAGKGLKMVFFARPGLVAQIDELQLVDIAVFDFEVPLMSATELKQFVDDFYPEMAGFSQEKITQAWNESAGNLGSAIEILKQYQAVGGKNEGLSFRLAKFETASVLNWSSLKNINIPVKHVLFLVVLAVLFLWVFLVQKTSQTEIFAPPKASVPLPERMNTILEGEQVVSDFEIAEMASENLKPGEPIVAAEPITQVTTSQPNAINRPEPTPPAEQLAAVKPVASTPAKNPVAIDAATPKGGTTRQAGKSVHSSDEQHLLDQSSGYYTLQVLSSSRSLSLSSYLLRQSNRKELYLYRSLRDGQRRYVVVAGIYKTRAAAVAAIPSLPREQQKAGPWPRSLRSVQREIEKF
ncbi:MAG: AAA family ATPase [Cellvibrionaceae bacterium]|nr:AAA family ATPase [Cellvibrionaceae bacterium]